MRTLALALALSLFALAFASCCCRSSGSFSSSGNVPVQSQVKEQNELHEALRAFPDQYRNAPNEIKKSDIFRQANAWKAGFGQRIGFAVRNWEGVVSDISRAIAPPAPPEWLSTIRLLVITGLLLT